MCFPHIRLADLLFDNRNHRLTLKNYRFHRNKCRHPIRGAVVAIGEKGMHLGRTRIHHNSDQEVPLTEKAANANYNRIQFYVSPLRTP